MSFSLRGMHARREFIRLLGGAATDGRLPLWHRKRLSLLDFSAAKRGRCAVTLRVKPCGKVPSTMA